MLDSGCLSSVTVIKCLVEGDILLDVISQAAYNGLLNVAALCLQAWL